MIDNSSIFTGLGGLYTPLDGTGANSKQQLKTFSAQVLDVCIDTNSTLYNSPRDIGKILFRDPVTDYNKPENTISKVAWPLDRSVARYPVPGEEVIIFRAYGDIGGTEATRSIGSTFFYSFVVSSMHNVSFNVDPFMATNINRLDPADPTITYTQAEQRFDKKRKDLDLSKDSSGNVKIYKQLQPYEGDFILQGRFGNTIRFGSTSPKTETPWAQGGTAPGTSGDGIMILRVDRDFSTRETDMLTTEDIDKDDSTIYLCTSQRVEITLGCSKELKSWKARYNLSDSSKSGAKDNVTKNKDTSELWQKPIDTSQPADQQYSSPTS
jgi:hypothetical protein